MKYLLSALFFLGFIFFNVPCFAGVTSKDASFNLQNQAVNVINQALLPGEVIQDASSQASLASETRIGVKVGFLEIIESAICALAQMIGVDYCPVDFADGENITQISSGSKIQGQSYLPENMELIPAKKDEALGSPDPKDTGNNKLNQISENLGTTTGFYGSDQPPLSYYEICVQERMKEYNFNLNGTSFEKEQRSADVYCRKQVFCQGSYPNDICPFEPPTP